VQRAGVAAFETEAILEREEDRLDPLADPGQHVRGDQQVQAPPNQREWLRL
jgi:hypothetical protein